ncbi:MAG: DMT family transporter [Pararhodobacter sp.]
MQPVGAYAALLAIGAAWGLTIPLIKIATSAGHAAPGIALWHVAINLTLIGGALAITGRLHSLPRDAASLRLYCVFGLFGIALPQWASYSATTHLPAGITSIIVSLVPIFALPLALALGSERFSPRRIAGVVLGAGAIVLIAAPGSGSLPAPGLWVWVLVAALAPLFYAFEGAYVAASRAPGADPFQLLWAASLVALGVLLPVNIALGSFASPFAAPAGFGALMLAGVLTMTAYTGYILVLRRCGAVFGAQVAYLVTGCGVLWAMMLLGERYPSSVWLALLALFAGLFLVQPRPQLLPLAESPDVRP